MKIIREYQNQRHIMIKRWLTDKGYQIREDFHLYQDSFKVQEKWSQMWFLHANEANFIIVKQKENPFKIWVIDLEDSLATPEAIKYLIEKGKEPDLSNFLNFISIEEL